jgi:hypothetical protein
MLKRLLNILKKSKLFWLFYKKVEMLGIIHRTGQLQFIVLS